MSDGPITLTRDRWGIGHVDAPDALEAFAAQGRLAAADRAWQMEWDRRRALGRWAEVAGEAAVSDDRFFRRLGLAEVCRADWDALHPATRSMTEAYTRGVNAWLSENGDDMPPEFEHHPVGFEPWEAWHCLAVYKVRHLFMGTFHRKLWRGAVTAAVGPDLVVALLGDPGAASPIVPSDDQPIDLLQDALAVMHQATDDVAALADVDGASNSWVVHGSRTATGKPLLAGDPHRGMEFPNVYHQCHLRCPEFDVIGLAFPGVPGFAHFGHNAEVAWCITHGMADDTDVFVERGPLPVDRVETIEVFGADPVTVNCSSTDRGPVVLGEPSGEGPSLSMMWTALAGPPDSTLDCLWPMMQATSVDELETAVDRWVIPVNNLLSADREGEISFRIRGRVVERPLANRWTPVPADSEHDWNGLDHVPSEDLHRRRNPERGFLVTANNRVGDAGPFIGLDFAGPARHDRIVEMLTDLSDATVDDMRTIHGDTRSLVAGPLLAVLGRATPETESGRAALSTLRDWDGQLDADAVGPTIYTALRRHWSDEVGRRLSIGHVEVGGPGWPSALPASRMLFEGASNLLKHGTWSLLPGLSSDSDLAKLLGRLLDAAADELTERFGPESGDWIWERAHTMVSPHPLASARPDLSYLHPPVDGCSGDGDTVRCGSIAPHTGDRAASGSVARYAFDLADWDRSGWVVPHGVSGVRGGGHDLDQRPLWLACELAPMAYSAEAVASVAIHSVSWPLMN